MSAELFSLLHSALAVLPGEINFRDNFYRDELFFLESIQSGFAGWFNEEDIVPQVSFITEKCRLTPPAAVLDLACGHGRHAVCLAEFGYDVSGADVSPALVNYLNQSYRRSNLSFTMSSFQDLDDQGCYDLVQVLGNSLSLMPRSELAKSLKCFNRCLKSNGQLFLQLDNLDYYVEHEANTRPWDFAAGRWLMFSEHFYEADGRLEKTVDNSLDFETHVIKQYRLTKSLYTVDEITTFLGQAGILVTQTFGDWAGSSFSRQSPTLLIVARKQ